jgi:Tol biopolymer transport system component
MRNPTMRAGLLISYLAVLTLCSMVGAVSAVSAPTGPGRIAYGNRGNIWIVNPDGTGKKQLTFFGRDTSPNWSRDGRRIAFIRQEPDRRGRGTVYIIDADGNHPRPIVQGNCWSPLWSPVADELAFVRSSENGEAPGTYIAFVDARGKPTADPVLHLESKHLHSSYTGRLCDWSPDGKLLSVLVVGFIYFDIEVLAREKGKLTRHSLHEHSVESGGRILRDYLFHGWSQGGRSQILLAEQTYRFEKKGEYETTLVVAALDGTMHRQITTVHRGERRVLPTVVWSPDGKQIAYESAGSIYVTPIDAPRPRLIAEGDSPRWSPR